MPSLADRIQYRALIFAYLYGPPVPVTREEALRVFGSLSKSLCPTASFKYEPSEGENRLGFKVLISEKEGRRSCGITLDVHMGALRMRVDQSYPSSFQDGCERADDILAVIRPLASQSEEQLVEVRVRAQTATNKDSAQEFIAANLLGGNAARLHRLGHLGHFGIRYEIAPEQKADGPLDRPAREVVVEPLREEGSSLYVEVMSKWGRALLRASKGGAGHDIVPGGPLTYSVLKPSQYFGEVSEYVTGTLCPFLEG